MSDKALSTLAAVLNGQVPLTQAGALLVNAARRDACRLFEHAFQPVPGGDAFLNALEAAPPAKPRPSVHELIARRQRSGFPQIGGRRYH